MNRIRLGTLIGKLLGGFSYLIERAFRVIGAPFKRFPPPPPAPRPEPGPVPPESVRVLFGRQVAQAEADAQRAMEILRARERVMQARERVNRHAQVSGTLALVREYRRRVRALYSVRPRPWLSPNARAQALRERARAARGRG